MNKRLSAMIRAANRGESVYIDDIDRAFADERRRIVCTVQLPVGGEKRYTLSLPDVDTTDPEAFAFVRDYFHAWVYNIISAIGGRVMRFHIAHDDALASRLCNGVADAFCLHEPKAARTGYGKCLNVTDRVNASLGYGPFRFETVIGEPDPLPVPETPSGNAVSGFLSAIDAVRHGARCGLDIGGTDIKVVGVMDGQIVAVKEFDWDPGRIDTVDRLLSPILLLTHAICVALSVPADASEASAALRRQLLDKDASVEAMTAAANTLEAMYGLTLLDGIGISFPDVVINDRIVGGETSKMRGIRAASPDYEAEFAHLKDLNHRLAAYCKPGVVVRMANDGSLAAYTAAVEWAASEACRPAVRNGVFAHSLGTDLGTGWIDECGRIPQIPLEIYNCVIDLGNKPAMSYEPGDVRSARNFNTGLAGTPQKYTGQYGAYRIALKHFAAEAPEEYEKLFTHGYLERRSGGIHVVSAPKDMRKPLLEYLMELASAGQPQAEEIFREIGECLAVTRSVTEKLLGPKVDSRVLFGRFVKKPYCFRLICEGAARRTDAPFLAADNTLAYTPLMRQLDSDPEHTVAQFGQAVGAVYYSV